MPDMMESTQNIQKKVLNYASIAMILMALVISCIISYPLINRIKWYEEKNVSFARDTATLVLADFLEHLSEVSLFLAKQFNQIKNPTVDFLAQDLKIDDDLKGVVLVDKKGLPLKQVGFSEIPFLAKDAFKTPTKQKIMGPFLHNKHHYVYVYTGLKKGLMAKGIITIFSLDDLENNLHKKLHARLGQLVIAYINKNRVSVFSPDNLEWKAEASVNKNSLHQALEKAIIEAKKGLIEGFVLGKKAIVAYAPVARSGWGVAVIIDRAYLLSSLTIVIYYLVVAVFVIIILFLFGLRWFLQPLSGKLIMHADTLEKEIKKANAKLEKANDELSYAAHYDSLTDVLNRRGLEDCLVKLFARLKRQNAPMLLLYIDINKFKPINDAMGHDVGDAILVHVAKSLKQSTRKEDFVIRLGGDEFLVLMPDINNQQEHAITKKIKKVVNEKVICKKHVINTEISIGVATFPEDGVDFDALLKKADKRMYEDKKNVL